MNRKQFPKELRVVLPPIKHLSGTNKALSGIISIPAIELEYLNLISKHLDFKYVPMVPPDGAFGFQEKNGSWTGIIGMLSRQEADMAIAYLAQTQQRQKAVDFSYPYTVQEQVFITSISLRSPQMATYTYPFEGSVWITISVCFFSMTFLLRYLDFKSRKLVDMLTVMFGSLLRQSFYVTNNNLYYRISCISWWIFVTFMTLSYSSVLLAFLTIPLKAKGIRTMDALNKAVQSGSYKALVPMGSALLQQMLHSDHEHMRELGEAIKEKRWYYDVRENITKYFADRTVLIGPRLRFNGVLFKNKDISEDSFGTWNVGIALRKNFCCKSILNKFVLRSDGAGLYQKIIIDQLIHSDILYYSNLKENEASEALNWDDVHSVFVLLFIGLTLSLICLILEILTHNFVIFIRSKIFLRGRSLKNRLRYVRLLKKMLNIGS